VAAKAALVDGLAVVRYHQEAALQGEVEPLHQMRVAARRLRAAVELFATTLHGSRVMAYRRDLRWVGQVAGAVRECDMTAALIKERSSLLDQAMAAALEPVYERLGNMREAACIRLAAMVKTRRYQILGERLAHPLIRLRGPGVTVGECAPKMIGPLAAKVKKAGKRITMESPPEVFHTLRKRLKRLRYGLEMLAAAGSKHHGKAIARLEEMQELLGQHHDAVEVAGWLRAQAGQAEALPPATLMAAGAMIQELGRHQEKLAAQTLKQWKQVVHAGAISEALKEIQNEADRRRHDRRKAEAAGRAAKGMEPAPAAESGDGAQSAEAVPRSDHSAGSQDAA
jgi:CHAD domain-containing protein